MKIPNRRRIAVLSALAVLLAAATTGNFSICDAILLGPPGDADTLRVTVQAGQTEPDIARGLEADYYLFRLCPPSAVPGVYPVTHRVAGLLGYIAVVDLATSTTTPPGHYLVNYTKSFMDPFFPVVDLGLLDLTVTPGPEQLTACFYAQWEVIHAGQPVGFYASCSTGPIVLYKWWFNYNGNPSSTPSATTTGPITQTTLSAGQRTVRLVVRTAGGQEAETSHTYNVVAP